LKYELGRRQRSEDGKFLPVGQARRKKWCRCGRLRVGLFERPTPPEKVYFINGLGDMV